MLRLMLVAVAALFAVPSLADPAYELVTLRAKPGSLDALHDCLRNGVLSKHGGECLAVLVPAGENSYGSHLSLARDPASGAD